MTTMREVYGWDPERMAHDAEHVYSNSCPECSKPFKGMGHGLNDMTLDIIDPQKQPYYNLYTRWICMSCNRAKSSTPPDEWGQRRAYERKWFRRQQLISMNPHEFGPPQRSLFDRTKV